MYKDSINRHNAPGAQNAQRTGVHACHAKTTQELRLHDMSP